MTDNVSEFGTVKRADFSMLDYPKGAAVLRDHIYVLLQPLVDPGTTGDSGGGCGGADLWVKFGGCEYYISVKPSGPAQSPPEPDYVLAGKGGLK